MWPRRWCQMMNNPAPAAFPPRLGGPRYLEKILQYDMWKQKLTPLFDWEALKEKISRSGVKNSLLLACMPATATAQILGNNQSIEPYDSNIYTHRVLSEEFQISNIHEC
ncbi:ribonucleoside-diphosphate reductase large subunit-like isoform X2 [Festucalex cinctus]